MEMLHEIFYCILVKSLAFYSPYFQRYGHFCESALNRKIRGGEKFSMTISKVKPLVVQLFRMFWNAMKIIIKDLENISNKFYSETVKQNEYNILNLDPYS